MMEESRTGRVRSKSRTRWRKVRAAERGISRIDEEDESSAGQFQIFQRIVTEAERIRRQNSQTPKIFSLTKLVRKFVKYHVLN